MPHYSPRALCYSLLLLVLALPAQADSSLYELRDSYRLALKYRAENNETQYQQVKQKLQDYILYPYLEYEDQLRALDTLTPAAFEQFRQAYADTPLPRQLHRHWLAYLGKRKRWSQLIEAYDASVANTALECHYRLALLNSDRRQEAFLDLHTLWVVGRSQSDSCDPLFKVWLESEAFSPNYAWQRFWLALGNNNRTLARYTKRFITSEARLQKMQQALDLHHKPQQLKTMSQSRFDALSSPVKQIALKALSRKDPVGFFQLQQSLELETSKEIEQLSHKSALRLLKRYDEQAAKWASHFDPDFKSLELLEWRIREALFRQDWAMVETLLSKLPAASRFNDRWRYWQAQALKRGDAEQQHRAEQIFAELARKRSFYGFLSADLVGASYSMNNAGEPVAADELLRLSQRPALERARELFIHEQLIEARREWQLSTRDADPNEHYRLAHLARSWGWYAQAIRATIAARRWNDLVLRFPLAYSQQAAAEASRHRVETTWVMAVIRQESAFMTDARSPAGAMGLMQLMPATAKQTAKRQKLRYRGVQQLHLPDFNIKLGSAYLSQVYRRFDQQRALATAAYNAGPHRVKRWLEHRGHLPIDAWIETIPFDETRHYVQNVLSYALIYQDLMGLPKTFMPDHERRPLRPDSMEQ